MLTRISFLVFLLNAWSACSTHLPPTKSAAALHRDLERLVELAGAEGWSIDRVEVEEALAPALLSVCRTELKTRSALLSWLHTEIASAGGPVEVAYEARGRELSAVEKLVTLTRVHLLLTRSMKAAKADCPFWIRPTGNFAGRQILDDRWFMSVGGGGKAIVVQQAGQSDLNFGGAGRILVGRGIGRNATLLSGLELGGSAAFPRDENGERANITLAVDAVVPLVYRHRRVNSYWELETGYVAHLSEAETDVVAHGFRVGFALGGTASRRRWIFPGAVFGVSYERIFEDDALHLIKIGFRAAIDFDP